MTNKTTLMSTIFNYNHHGITFHPSSQESATMVNATDMAKAFGRRPNDFLCLDSTKRFVEAFQSDTRNSGITLFSTLKGNHKSGVKQGSWFYEDLAIKFAGWLNPLFEVWMVRHVKELMKTGKTSIDEISRKELALMILKSEEEKEQLMLQNNSLSKEIETQKPKVLFAEAVTASPTSILMGDLAKILNQNGIPMGQNRLFEWMRTNGYLLSKGSFYNQPSQYAMELGLFEISETTIHKPHKDPFIKFTTKVTGKGQLYFINKFTK